MNRNLELARWAWQKWGDVPDNAASRGEYRDALLVLAVTLYRDGLAAGVASLLREKGGPRVIQHLSEVELGVPHAPEDLFSAIRGMGTLDYIRASREILKRVEWLRRIAREEP